LNGNAIIDDAELLQLAINKKKHHKKAHRHSKKHSKKAKKHAKADDGDE